MRRAALAFVLLGACHHRKPPPVAPPPEPPRACLAEPPPKETPVSFEGPPACPGEYVACLRVPEALALERNVRALRQYARAAWARCGAAAGSPPMK